MSSITKAVIYARYSSHNQREESIEGQLRICHDYAIREGIQIVGEYIDRAQSATTDKRVDFQRMIKDAKKECFSLVLVYNLDRFARNRYDSAKYKAILKKHGVTLKSVTQAIPDGPDGIILESVMEGLNEYYSANLARNVKRGLTENALSFRVNGPVPYGYKKGEDGTYAIDETTAPMVLQIFERYTNGEPKKEIIDFLNASGCKTKAGKPFKINSLDRILKNRRYTGVYIFGEIEEPDAIPAIISIDMYDKAQKVAKLKARIKGRMTDDIYFLTGKLFCGHCKKPMVGESGKGRGGSIYRYYKCQAAKKTSGACDKKPVRKEKIESWVIENLQNRILTDENIKEISNRIFQNYKKELEDESHINQLKSDLKDCTEKLSNIVAAIEAGCFTKTMTSRMQELESEIEELQDAIAVEEGRKAVVTLEMIENYLFRLRAGAESSSDYKKALVNTFVDKIYLFDDKGVIFFRLNTDGEPMTIEGDVSDIVRNAQPLQLQPNLFLVLGSGYIGFVIDLWQ